MSQEEREELAALSGMIPLVEKLLEDEQVAYEEFDQTTEEINRLNQSNLAKLEEEMSRAETAAVEALEKQALRQAQAGIF